MKTSEKLCPFCERSFPETAIRKHMGIVHLGLNVEDFDEPNEVAQVAQVEIEFVDVKKEVTELFDDSKPSLTGSEIRSKDELFECGQCDKKYQLSNNLERHRRRIHEGLVFKCQQCDQAFPTEAGLQNHIEAKHDKNVEEDERSNQESPGNVLFNCPQCDKKFQHMNSVYRHQRIIHENRKFPCRRCGRSFGERRDLMSHMEASKHGRSTSQDDVDKIDFQLQNVEVGNSKEESERNSVNSTPAPRKRGRPSKAEQERRSREEKYTCDSCHKSFNKKTNLKRHVDRDHLNIKNFLCSDCGKAFAEKAKLTIHTLSVHKNIRFACGMCEKSYTSKAHLRTHVKVTHEEGIAANLKNCSKCSYSSLKKANLKRHMLEVHEKRKEKCDFCEMFFGRSELKRHIKLKHTFI